MTQKPFLALSSPKIGSELIQFKGNILCCDLQTEAKHTLHILFYVTHNISPICRTNTFNPQPSGRDPWITPLMGLCSTQNSCWIWWEPLHLPPSSTHPLPSSPLKGTRASGEGGRSEPQQCWATKLHWAAFSFFSRGGNDIFFLHLKIVWPCWRGPGSAGVRRLCPSEFSMAYTILQSHPSPVF